MNLSENKRSALYEAISEPIMKKRIIIQGQDGVYQRKDLDDLLYNLEREIWAEVRKALNISGS